MFTAIVHSNEKAVQFRARSPKRALTQAAQYVQGSGVFCGVLQNKQGTSSLFVELFNEGDLIGKAGKMNGLSFNFWDLRSMNRVIDAVLFPLGEVPFSSYDSGIDPVQYGSFRK